jgi:ATP-dependent RNA helicase DDX5/DBP2
VSEWRKLHGITLLSHSGDIDVESMAAPYREFRDTPFNTMILQLFVKAGFSRPTGIQSQAWPIAIQKHDMICIAKTGSGKTCGFLLPYFYQHIQNKGSTGVPRRFGGSSGSKPTMLILAPTRELSVQIQEEANKFGRPLNISSLCCYGGTSKYPQIQALQRSNIDCLIATPGRLNDLLEMKKADLSEIKFFVLDEVSFLFCTNAALHFVSTRCMI